MTTDNTRETQKHAAPEAHGEGHMLPVWFFVGLLLFIYGILIFFTGISEWSHPPANLVLANLHATFWWGILLIIIGAIFTIANRPGHRN